MSELTELANKFGSDKGTSHHHQALDYMPLYEQYFQLHGFTRDSKLSILEIGTNKGASLRTWAEYFPNASVTGIDITTKYEDETLLAHPNICHLIANQGDREELRSVLQNSKYDIIIDDGSHEQYDQQTSLGYLFSHLNKNGLYVIEDLITGDDWWDGKVYNKKHIKPTKSVIKELEQTFRLESSAILDSELDYFKANYGYCHYRESKKVIFEHHHPQICFIGKK